jgi:hypothetical protein
LYILIYNQLLFWQNWYPRETSLLFTGRQMWCSMSVQKCIRFCSPELQSWPEVKNTNMKFMKTQDKNTQISVYCIQHLIVHPRGVVFPGALARGKTTSQGWTIMMFTANAGNNCFIIPINNNVGCNKHLFVCFYLVFS